MDGWALPVGCLAITWFFLFYSSMEPEADFALHYPNIPARYDCPANLAEPMVTVKKRYEQGDV